MPLDYTSADVVILCGGRGKRLGPLTSKIPKPLLRIKQRPFLEILIGSLYKQGFRRFILCTGYKKELLKKYFQSHHAYAPYIFFSEEKKPLGTGGAIYHARKLILSEAFFVLNGDSLCRYPLKKIFSFHRRKHADVSILLAKQKEQAECGFAKLDHNSKIVTFSEKETIRTKTYINTGVYVFSGKIFQRVPWRGSFSLEYDLFPKLCSHGKLYGLPSVCTFLDIGTPQRLQKAQRSL